MIIVDNNSSDNTRDVVMQQVDSFPVPLRYLMEKEQGRSAALNAGIRVAQGEILAITDDDVRVDPLWLRNARTRARTIWAVITLEARRFRSGVVRYRTGCRIVAANIGELSRCLIMVRSRLNLAKEFRSA